MSRRIIVGSIWAIGGVAAALLVVWFVTRPSPEDLLRRSRQELARLHFAQAEQLALEAAQYRRTAAMAYLLAGEAALKDERPLAALDDYRQVPGDAGESTVAAQFGIAEVQLHLGDFLSAEASFNHVLQLDPHHIQAHHRLAYFLSATGRRWQSIPHLLELVKQREATLGHLLLLGNSQQIFEDHQMIAGVRDSEDDLKNPWPAVGAARTALSLNEPQKARTLLEPLAQNFPEEPEIQVRWGEVLMVSREWKELAKWNAGLARQIEVHPELWVLRGQLCEQNQRTREAARCYWEAVRRDSEHQLANYRLGQTLKLLGENQKAQPFLDRAELLRQLALVLNDISSVPSNIDSLHQACRLTERLGRLWETVGWAGQARPVDATAVWPQQIIQRLMPQLIDTLPRTKLEGQAIAKIDLSDLPLPKFDQLSKSATLQTASGPPRFEERFRNDAAATGIHFQYFNSEEPQTPGARILETTGGGVGVVDYDADYWPDLYFTQGAARPAVANAVVYRDEFFRNDTTGHYVNVADFAGLGDTDFSQGISAGDYDNDGFTDLYLANFGANRLYHNNGDGTFSDVTAESGLTGQRWTTSCLLADVNGDSWPDIYDVNYCAGDKIETLTCARQDVVRPCSPREFDAAQDKLWLNQGDGRFVDVSAESGIERPSGYGLGIVAADFTGSGRLSLFVANDEAPNFFFVNQEAASGARPRFAEQALAAGVAVNAEGHSQACMGVAVGDTDGNGLLDLFITNFYNESNTLYRQLAPGQFSDDTRIAGLRDPSFSMLGFGTQFLDGDRDGNLDLIVTNGHIDDLTKLGQPFRMSPQYFHNRGQGQFDEVSARQLGPFFQQKYLGRGLAKLDWNRDGHEDFAVSHVNAPAALVTNTTPDAAHFLEIHLRGRSSSRDAIGTIIQIKTAVHSQTAQLTAGDGYQASNERHILLGLGSSQSVDELTVRWPAGSVQTWNNLAADHELLLIEGQEHFHSIR